MVAHLIISDVSEISKILHNFLSRVKQDQNEESSQIKTVKKSVRNSRVTKSTQMASLELPNSTTPFASNINDKK